MNWLWVAKVGGMDGPVDLDSEWIWDGCDPDTEPGEYALIYRIYPHSHIKYLVEITKDSYLNMDLVPDEIYSCGFKVLVDFENEVGIDEMKAKKELINWRPLKISFQGKVFEIDHEHWKALKELITSKNPDAKSSFE